ncbi:MAG: TIGR02757 family protein [Bacteroidetes bacterium]|nr:TIGR02757 family protein [Bacteroidota bacterium]
MTSPDYPDKAELKELLNDRYELYNRKSFIENDPVCIPHLFENEDDIAISGFLTATIAWGQRPVLIRNARKMMHWMDDAPADYIRHFRESDLDRMQQFVHRTFSGTHLIYMIRALQQILQEEGKLEKAFKSNEPGAYAGITAFRQRMLRLPDTKGVSRHIADPEAGSAAKRLNMFLRWMVRSDNRGVDFGIWKIFSPAELICPLDVHSGGVARKLGLLSRKQDDRKAAEELTDALKEFDAEDPVKYDFALFGLGVNENFRKI